MKSFQSLVRILNFLIKFLRLDFQKFEYIMNLKNLMKSFLKLMIVIELKFLKNKILLTRNLLKKLIKKFFK